MSKFLDALGFINNPVNANKITNLQHLVSAQQVEINGLRNAVFELAKDIGNDEDKIDKK